MSHYPLSSSPICPLLSFLTSFLFFFPIHYMLPTPYSLSNSLSNSRSNLLSAPLSNSRSLPFLPPVTHLFFLMLRVQCHSLPLTVSSILPLTLFLPPIRLHLHLHAHCLRHRHQHRLHSTWPKGIWCTATPALAPATPALALATPPSFASHAC